MVKITVVTRHGVIREALLKCKPLEDRESVIGQAWELHEAGVTTAEVGRNLWPYLVDPKKRARRLINRARKAILTLPAFRSGRYRLPPYGRQTLSIAAENETGLQDKKPGEFARKMVSRARGRET